MSGCEPRYHISVVRVGDLFGGRLRSSACRSPDAPTRTDNVARLSWKLHEAQPCGLPCSAEQDKSHLGQTGVSVKEKARRREKGEELSSSPSLVSFSSLSCPLFRFDGQQ